MAVVDGLISSVALILGLLALLSQMRQQADSNVIGALVARQQFLLAESERLENDIQRHKSSEKYDDDLVRNMANKKSRLLKEAERIDKQLETLLKIILKER